MFDPHHIGPRTSSFYSKNKGRVIQRKIVDPISTPITRTELEKLVPVMVQNGIIAPPLPYFSSSDRIEIFYDSATFAQVLFSQFVYYAEASKVTINVPANSVYAVFGIQTYETGGFHFYVTMYESASTDRQIEYTTLADWYYSFPHWTERGNDCQFRFTTPNDPAGYATLFAIDMAYIGNGTQHLYFNNKLHFQLEGLPPANASTTNGFTDRIG